MSELTTCEKDTIIKILNERLSKLLIENQRLTRKVKTLKKDKACLIRSLKLIK